MANLTYLSKGNPCLLIDGAEYFGAAAKRLHAYESTGYEPGEVNEMADRLMRLEISRREEFDGKIAADVRELMRRYGWTESKYQKAGDENPKTRMFQEDRK